MTLNGEVAWLCLLCCNTDISFSALVINWITSPGQEATLHTLTRPSRGVSTFGPDEGVPLDPDGNSIGATTKRWEQRRTNTSTTIGNSSADSQAYDVEQDLNPGGGAREEASERGVENAEAQNQDDPSKTSYDPCLRKTTDL
ncbi:hypothetical protein LZ32DRAFT_58455 [Colletotrichum eremochloae]|nr:hypothetical protein LZ32DRAFT_58455 [Colletotrichum eremochloae]